MNYYTITAPASKSYSHRYLIGALLSGGIAEVKNVLYSEDTEATYSCIKSLGARVTGSIIDARNVTMFTKEHTPCVLHCGNSATLSRIFSVLMCVGSRICTIQTGEQLARRTHAELLCYIEALHARITFHEHAMHPPFTIEPSGASTSTFIIGEQHSSQYLSGLLFACSLMHTVAVVVCSPWKLASFPYILMTLYTLQDFGIRYTISYENREECSLEELAKCYMAQANPVCITIYPSTYKTGTYTVPSDWSNMSYLLAIGLIGDVPIAVACTEIHAIQGDSIFLEIVQKMGGNIYIKGETVYTHKSTLHAIDIDMGQYPDLVPTVAVLIALSAGYGRISNIAPLRTKECDRIAYLARGLQQLGFFVIEEEDALIIGDSICKPEVEQCIATAQDHRMAMAFSLFTFAGYTLHVDNTVCVEKSFPSYWKVYNSIRHLV